MNEHFDINYWYSKNNGVCPNCKADMKKFHPSQNIYPHFTGSCLTYHAPNTKSEVGQKVK